MNKLKNWVVFSKAHLTILRISDIKTPSGLTKWEAICSCGNTCFIYPSNLKSGRIQSCGHLSKEASSKMMSNKRKYEPKISSARRVWQKRYKDGISFENFTSYLKKNVSIVVLNHIQNIKN